MKMGFPCCPSTDPSLPSETREGSKSNFLRSGIPTFKFSLVQK